MKRSILSVVGVTGIMVSAAFAQNGDRDGHVMKPPPAHWEIPPAPVVSAAEAAATIELEEGFSLDLVAAEPMIQDPVALTFDGDGRIWVAEMRGYMPDIDGHLEDETYGRISVLEDTDGDGKVDKHTVFLEKYLLPRAVALVNADKSLLFADNTCLYEAEIKIDDAGNISAGEVTMVDEHYADGGNPEHKPNGLLYALDNWIYSSKCNQRYRKINGEWIKELTEDRGQWGIAQDNFGRLITNTNSNLVSLEEIPPGLTKRNPNYDFRSNVVTRVKDQAVWPARITPGVNRGYMEATLDDNGFLATPTAASAMVMYRGDQFPSEFVGNIFIPEPAGNLVKRTVTQTNDDGFHVIESAYKDGEFFTSTDERSRIVNAYNAPDGSLYLVDFYRGIIQHSVYMTSYLRAQVEERGLDIPDGLGRIWRVSHSAGESSAEKPGMTEESSVELVAHLSHPNGWWRDTAQRIIVERGGDEAVGALNKLVAKSEDPLGKVHALWTLEGLAALTPATVEVALAGSNPRVAAEAIRAAESLVETEDADAVFSLIESVADTDDIYLQRQVAASAGLFGDGVIPFLAEFAVRTEKDRLIGDLVLSGVSGHELALLKKLPVGHDLRVPLVETLVRRNDQIELREVASLLESPKAFEGFAAAAVAKRRSKTARDLLARAGEPDTDPKIRAAIARGLIRGGKDKKFKPMPVKEIAALDQIGRLEGVKESDVKAIGKLFNVGSGEEITFLKTAEHRKQFEEGRVHYQRICLACHQAHGNGMQYLAPPLVGSEWVLDSPKRLIALAMDGAMGPIEVLGKVYTAPEIQPLMPGLRLNPEVDDAQLAAILTYVRNEWGNAATPISTETVAKYRSETEARTPWSPEDLKKIK